MYPGAHAQTMPHKAAAINATTEDVLTYGDLNDRSIQLARLWHAHGLRSGDHVALLMENNLRFFEVVWAALRSGLYITAINWHLTLDEAAYIINDCGARAIVSSSAMGSVAGALADLIPNCSVRLMTDGRIDGWTPYEAAIADHPVTALAQEPLGDSMLYSSGTTGRPKGIKRPLAGGEVTAGSRSRERLSRFGFHQNTIYLSPAPLYHAAPFGYTIGTQSLGGTVVMMERFNELESLRLIEHYRVRSCCENPLTFRFGAV